MSDTSILYAGIFCFSLIILCFGLTVREFSRMTEAGTAGKRKA